MLFLITTLIGGFLFPNYSHVSQYISEAYAADAEYGHYLRWFGFIPSGLLFCLFFIFNYRYLNASIFSKLGTLGFLILYGIGTIICSIFYCDAGCMPEHPSRAQIIHDISGGLFYLFLPLLYLFIFKGLDSKNVFLKKVTFLFFMISLLSNLAFFTFFDSNFKGLLQRVIEGMLLIWICIIDFGIKPSKI